jgi:uncharacterized protein (TIGR03086 family)
MFNPIPARGVYGRGMTTRDTTTSIDTTSELLRTVLTDLATAVGRVAAGQLHDRTPCAEFDVEQLRHHILGWLTLFAAGFTDPDGRAAADIDGYTVSADPAAEVRAAADQLAAALAAGAGERTLWLGEAGMPGELALGMLLWEYQMHGWDLARATGQSWTPPEAALAHSLEFAPAMLSPDFQGEGKSFGPAVAVAADASALDRLLGLSGRDPHWTAKP